MDRIIADLSEYYDKQTPSTDRIALEIKLLNSEILNDYMKTKFDDYYLISKSISSVKNRLNRH